MPLSKQKQVIQLTFNSEYPLSLNIQHLREVLTREYGYDVVAVRGAARKVAR